MVGRMERERVLARVLINAAREALTLGPWRRVNVSPELKVLSFDQRLARAAREEGVG